MSTSVGNEGSAQLGSSGSGPIPKGSTPVGNPGTPVGSGGSGPIPQGGKMKPDA